MRELGAILAFNAASIASRHRASSAAGESCGGSTRAAAYSGTESTSPRSLGGPTLTESTLYIAAY